MQSHLESLVSAHVGGLDIIIPLRLCGFTADGGECNEKSVSCMNFNVFGGHNTNRSSNPSACKFTLQYSIVVNRHTTASTSNNDNDKRMDPAVKVLQCRVVVKVNTSAIDSTSTVHSGIVEKSQSQTQSPPTLYHIALSCQELWKSFRCIVPTDHQLSVIPGTTTTVITAANTDIVGILDYINTGTYPKISNSQFCANFFTSYHTSCYYDSKVGVGVGKRACIDLIWDCYEQQTKFMLSKEFKTASRDNSKLFSYLVHGFVGETETLSSGCIHDVDYTLLCFLQSMGNEEIEGNIGFTWLHHVIDKIRNSSRS